MKSSIIILLLINFFSFNTIHATENNLAKKSNAEQSNAEQADQKSSLAKSQQELNTTLGNWNVTTEFLNTDGSIVKAVTGTYQFKAVIPGKVLSGVSEIPELNQTSAILFYLNEKDKKIEMVSVGADGKLWTMTSPLGGDTRTTLPYKTADGKDAQLRFTRYNVKKDFFESKMEYTQDGGKTWVKGNHQVFKRQK